MQYLHQVGLLSIIPALVGPVLIPPAVDAELAVGRSLGLNLPDPATLAWVTLLCYPPYRTLATGMEQIACPTGAPCRNVTLNGPRVSPIASPCRLPCPPCRPCPW